MEPLDVKPEVEDRGEGSSANLAAMVLWRL